MMIRLYDGWTFKWDQFDTQQVKTKIFTQE